MSIEIVLLPLAIAAVSAWQAQKAEAGQQVVSVTTRMRNEHLLAAALGDTGATVTRSDDGVLAAWGSTSARFTKDPHGIWTVHLDGEATSDEAIALVQTLDSAYGRRVQQEVLARLRRRAPEAGMTVESETVEDDDSVTLTLTVGG